MKKILLISGIIILNLLLISTVSDKENTSKVFFTDNISSEGVQQIFEQLSNNVYGNVAIKVHFGEEGNQNFLDPQLIQELTTKLNAILVETNVLYVSKRRYTESHIQLAKDHGFDFAPIDILDSEGETIIPVKSKNFTEVKVGSHLDNYDSLIMFSHFKGHGMAGFGGAIKNVSMGLASIAGKMAMHASAIPLYAPSRCTSCGNCVKECPGGAITIDPLVIDPEKCIGCGICIGVCPTGAFGVPWGSTDRNVFLERLVEYTQGIVKDRNVIYINVLANISPDCDCDRYAKKPFMDDIGILASNDIVAIEKASHDLVDKAHNCDDTFLKENSKSGKQQIEYAYELGLGNKNYELVDIDK